MNILYENFDEDLAEDITMKGDKYHLVQERTPQILRYCSPAVLGYPPSWRVEIDFEKEV